MIIDTHAHYDDNQFCDNLSELVCEMTQNGVDKIITCAVDYDSAENVLKLCEKYPLLYAAVGIYPHETHKIKWDKEKLAKLASHKKVKAIGEIGLDYYYDDSPREIQLDILKKQIELANELDLPITYHDRDAHADSLEILKEFKPKGVVHCFSGSLEMAEEIIKLGMYIGVGGALTFKNARVLPNVVREISLEKIVLETDAPYMAPVPKRGKCNRSDYIIYIAEKIADIKNISVKDVLKTTAGNALEIFSF